MCLFFDLQQIKSENVAGFLADIAVKVSLLQKQFQTSFENFKNTELGIKVF